MLRTIQGQVKPVLEGLFWVLVFNFIWCCCWNDLNRHISIDRRDFIINFLGQITWWSVCSGKPKEVEDGVVVLWVPGSRWGVFGYLDVFFHDCLSLSSFQLSLLNWLSNQFWRSHDDILWGLLLLQQGNYSLRRPSKLIIFKNMHWLKMG